MLFVYLLRGRIIWLLGICSTLVNLKAVIFPHRNDYNNDNNKNNRLDTGYDGESMISGLISYAALLLRQLFIGMDLVPLLCSFWGRWCIRGYWLTEAEASCQEVEDVAQGGSGRAGWGLQSHSRNFDGSINSERCPWFSLWPLGC